ncbi:MAG: hypothetical protein IJ685_01985 [Selenomonadaceae bacterium]|nr:hypothetical protein [Selenomonadaceae bacterium]
MQQIFLDELEKIYSDYVDDYRIGDDTPKNFALPMINLSKCFLDTEHAFPATQYKIFRVVEDMGLRHLKIDAFEGDYRSFRVEYDGEEKIISLSTSSYSRNKTIICFAVDKENYAHHALQLTVDNRDKNVEVIGDTVRFFHSGRIAVGKFGSGKISELRELVEEKYPQIISGKKFFLGTLTHDRLWTLEDEQIIRFVENLISYALIRDDYREIVIKRCTSS